MFDFLNYVIHLDLKISLFIQKEMSTPLFDSIFLNITDLHKNRYFIFLVIIPLLIYWIYKEKKIGLKKMGSLIFLLSITDFICGQFIKKTVVRPRPFELYFEILQKSPASGYSFVSNHAANMTALAVFLSILYPRTRFIWWTLALFIGFSRIYNGVHYFSDVFVGGIIGGSMGYFTGQWLDKRLRNSNR